MLWINEDGAHIEGILPALAPFSEILPGARHGQ